MELEKFVNWKIYFYVSGYYIAIIRCTNISHDKFSFTNIREYLSNFLYYTISKYFIVKIRARIREVRKEPLEDTREDIREEE